MSRKPGRIFVDKEVKKNAVIATVVLAIVAILIAIVSLLSNSASYTGDESRIGMATGTMFPFAYTDGNCDLVVIDENKKANVVDDNVSDVIHDYTKDMVYYIREKVVYEYNIKSGKRSILIAGGVKEFRILNDRSAIVYITALKELHLYNIIHDTDLDMGRADDNIIIGRNGFLFFRDVRSTTDTGKLYYSDNEGIVQLIANNVCVSTVKIAENEETIGYETRTELCVCDREGNKIAELPNAHMIFNTENAQQIENPTASTPFNEGIEMSYAYADDSLWYFTGKEFRKIADDFVKTINYASDGDRIFYIAGDEQGWKIMMSERGKDARNIAEIQPATSCMYCANTGKMYCLYQRKLYMLDVYENNSREEIADNVTDIYTYPGKQFVVYVDDEGNNNYILSDKETAKVADSAFRYYGTSNDIFLLVSTNDDSRSSLDLVDKNGMQRIASNIKEIVAFDSKFENILYLTEDGLVLQTNDDKTILTKTSEVNYITLKH